MRLLRLRARNFKHLTGPGGWFELDFLREGIIGLQGDNEAGKSSVQEALFIAITGDSLWRAKRGVVSREDEWKIEDYINSDSRTVRVELDFEVGDQRYKVVRILRRDGGNSAWLDGPRGRVSGISSVNERMTELMGGVDPDLLRATVFVIQKDVERPMKLPSQERMRFVNKMLGLDKANKALNLLSEMKKGVRKELEDIGEDIEKIEERLKQAESDVQKLPKVRERVKLLESESDVEGSVAWASSIEKELEEKLKQVRERLKNVRSFSIEYRNYLERLKKIKRLRNLRREKKEAESKLSKIDQEIRARVLKVRRTFGLVAAASGLVGLALLLLRWNFSRFAFLVSIIFIVAALLKSYSIRKDGEVKRAGLVKLCDEREKQLREGFEELGISEDSLDEDPEPPAKPEWLDFQDEKDLENIISSLEKEEEYLRNEHTKAVGRRSSLEKELEEKKGKLEDLKKLKERIEEMKSKLGQLNEKKSKREWDLKVLEKALQILERALESLRSGIIPMIEANMGKILPIATLNRYRDARIDENFRIKVLDQRMRWKDYKKFSGGTEDQIVLALRLAFSTSLLPKGPDWPEFLILDESLGHSDSSRRREIIRIFSDVLRDHFPQVIVISQHEDVFSNVNRLVRLEDGRISSIRGM